MAELPKYRPLGVSIASIPTVDFASTGAAQARVYSEISNRLDAMSRHMFSREEQQAKAAGTDIGAAQSEETLARLRDQNFADMTVRDQAAYLAATDAASTKVETEARRTMGEIVLRAEMENMTPQALQAELDDAAVGFASSVSSLSPVSSNRLFATLSRLKDAEYLGYSKSFIKNQIAQDQAQGIEGLDMITRNIETMARANPIGFDDVLDEEVANLEVYLAHQQFGPAEIAKQSIATRSRAHKARLRGMFEDVEGAAAQAVFIEGLQKDLEAGGDLTKGLDDKAASTLIGEFTQVYNGNVKTVKSRVTSLSSKVKSDVGSLVSKGAVPSVGVIEAFRVQAEELALDGGDVSKILETLDNAENDADFIRSLGGMSSDELRSERNALSEKQYEGTTSSELLRLGAVKQRLSELETENADVKKVLSPISVRLKKDISELEKVIDDFRPIPDGAFDNIDEALNILAAYDFDGADVIAFELNQIKLRAKNYEQLRSASPTDLAVVRSALAKQSDAEGASPELNRQINAIDSRIRAQNTALKSDPIDWAKETGAVSPDNIIANLVGKTFDERQEIYKERSEQADAFSAKMGRPAEYLDANEAATLANELKQSNVDERMALISEINNGFGINSFKVFGQISKDAPEIAHVAGLLNMGGNAQTAKDALRGLDLMRDGIVLRVSGQKTDATARAKARLGNMSRSPSTMKGILLTADAIYAARSGGEEIFNSRIYDTALQEASGMLTASDGRNYGGIVGFKGNGIVIPTNIAQEGTTFGADLDLDDVIDKMDQDDFVASAGGAFPLTQSGPVNFERLKDNINLVQKDDGSVAVLYERDDMMFGLTTPSGEEFTIDLRVLAQSVIDKRAD